MGLWVGQVTLLKQEKVAALADSDARLALKSPFEVRRPTPRPQPEPRPEPHPQPEPEPELSLIHI